MQAIQPKQIVSLLPHLATPTLDLAKIEDAHELEAVDLVVAEAELGVAKTVPYGLPMRRSNIAPFSLSRSTC